MPNYRVHDAINLTSYGMGLTAYGMATNIGLLEPLPITPLAGFTVAFMVGTFLISPDLDLHGSKPKKRWGLLRILWRPYASLMPHRKLSHGYLLGPLTRIAYLALITAPLALLPAFTTPLQTYLLPLLTTDLLISILIGYYVSQWLHLLADKAPLRL